MLAEYLHVICLPLHITTFSSSSSAYDADHDRCLPDLEERPRPVLNGEGHVALCEFTNQ